MKQRFLFTIYCSLSEWTAGKST